MYRKQRSTFSFGNRGTKKEKKNQENIYKDVFCLSFYQKFLFLKIPLHSDCMVIKEANFLLQQGVSKFSSKNEENSLSPVSILY